MAEEIINEFDLFAVHIKINCISLDEVIVGYFFGKKNENLEYTFFNFPASVRQRLPDINNNPHLNFKEELNEISNKLIPDHPEIVERSAKLMDYINIQFRKIGGLERFSKKVCYLFELDEKDEISMELLGLFDNWVEKKELQYTAELFSAEDYTKQVMESAEFYPEMENITNYLDLTKMTEFYPLIDPIQGISIDAFEVGMSLRITILSFPDEETEKLIKDHYQDHIDPKEGYLKTIEADIVSKELLSGKNDTYVLVKVRLCEDIYAFSIILKSLKLNRNQILKRNLLPPIQEEDESIPSGEEKIFTGRIKKETKVFSTLKEKAKFKITDLILVLIIVGGSIALTALLIDLISKR
jgi:hypothetical protein